MTKESLAALLDGNQYGNEISKHEEALAKAAGLVVVFGYSDDNVEFRGAIHDEVACYEGGIIYVERNKVLEPHDDCECKFCGYERSKKQAAKIEANWGTDGYSWKIDTALPHASFDIMEDGNKFCKGIVFHIDAISPF